jgi:hypothetical protein
LAASNLYGNPLVESYATAAAVTPSNSVDLAQVPNALYVGVSGDVSVNMSGSGSSIVFKAAPVGVLKIRPSRVLATGTTATNILALY